MPRTLDSKVRIYVAMVDSLPRYTDELEVEATYLWREDIANALDAGEKLDAESKALLQRADQRLVEQRPLLVKRFPTIFAVERKAEIPRRYWWWYLDEGPQVREQAERVA